MGVVEAGMVVIFKAGGIAVVSAAVEKTLELMNKEGLAQVVRVVGTVVLIYFVATNAIPLLNGIGGKLLRPF